MLTYGPYPKTMTQLAATFETLSIGQIVMEPFFHAETQKKAETKYDQIFLFSAEKAKKLETKKTGFEKNLEVKLFYSSKADANQKKKKRSQ